MCRLDQLAFRSRSVSDFWKMHPDAAKRKFGFLFRSPTVWEDMVGNSPHAMFGRHALCL